MIRASGLWLGESGDDIRDILRTGREINATDIHILAGSPVYVRVDGTLRPYSDDHLSASMSKHLSYALLSEKQIATFEERRDLDFMSTDDDLHRYRINVSYNNGTVGAVIRLLPNTPLSLESIKLPPAVEEMTHARKGLVLITGSTSQGKTTTMASMIDAINHHSCKHVVTIEDPIEYLHVNDRSIIRQREVGRDTETFNSGLRAALRQDPDVILIGEMRDFETVMIALRAAETGTLVLSTLHILSLDKIMDRLISYAPPGSENLLRTMISSSLRGVVHQELLSTLDGGKRVAAEILLPNQAVRNVLRNGTDYQLRNIISMGSNAGMQTMQFALESLYVEGAISEAMRDDVVKSYTTHHGTAAE